MLLDSLHLSVSSLRNTILNDLSLFSIALAYVLVYVTYKALGRYVYFSPQEHTSKINRTFLAMSLLALGFNLLSKINDLMPILPQYRWVFTLSALVILISPLSILVKRLFWKYHKTGPSSLRSWCYDYLPVSKDYFKTTTSRSDKDGHLTSYWEEEVVASTADNLHSDALLNLSALLVFICTSAKWAYLSYPHYGLPSFLFSLVTILWISGIFLDRGVFSWIDLVNKKWR